MTENNSKSLQEIIDSIQHPFYVIDVLTYKIKFANKACGFGNLTDEMTCHLKTHKSSTPCAGQHICPLEVVKKTWKPVKTEHVHFDKDGSPKNMEVHGDPVFDEKGNLILMIEYAFDITERKQAEQALKQKLEEIEKFNNMMMGREKRVIELKKEVDKILKESGKSPKYNI